MQRQMPSGEGTTFRPSPVTQDGGLGRPVLVGGAVCGLVIVVLAFVKPFWLLAAAPLTVAGATAAICTVVAWTYLRWAHVTVTPDRVTAVGVFGLRYSIARADIGATTFLGKDSTGSQVRSGRTPAYDVGALYIADRHNRQFLKLNTRYWAAATLQALAAAIGAPQQQSRAEGYRGDVVRVSRFARAQHEHPVRTVLLMGFGLAVAMIAVAFAVGGIVALVQ